MKVPQFIGKRIEITESSCNTLLGLVGKIIDETASSFTIEKDDGNFVTVMKNQIRFRIGTVDNVIIDGRQISQRPEERIKRIK